MCVTVCVHICAHTVQQYLDGQFCRDNVLKLALYKGVECPSSLLPFRQQHPRLQHVSRCSVELKLGMVQLQREVCRGVCRYIHIHVRVC